MLRFAGIEAKYANKETAKVFLQPIPYDGTSTWGKGADRAFEAFMEAAQNMELYDIETDSEPYLVGIYTENPLVIAGTPKDVFNAVYTRTRQILNSGKFPTFLGGEHSISIGIIKAFYEYYKDLSVLHLDAHADLRKEYQGTPYNHACAMHDASKHTNLVQVGIRSMDKCEKQFLNRNKTFFACDIFDSNNWFEEVLELLTDTVYITIDLDVFAPGLIPATGTPEPGGLSWFQVLKLLKLVFEHKNVVGFDIVELAPMPYLLHPQFTAAKLYYKMLAYKFFL